MRLSRRSNSVDSVPHIPMVDDESLDSASDNNTDFGQLRRQHIQLKKKDVETNTDHTHDHQQHKQKRSYYDDRGKFSFILNIHFIFTNQSGKKEKVNKFLKNKKSCVQIIENLIPSVVCF